MCRNVLFHSGSLRYESKELAIQKYVTFFLIQCTRVVTPMPKFSVIMPTFNRAEYLELTLEGYARQTLDDFELVIVNDGGDDHTDDVIRAYSSRLAITYIRQENMGRSAARNIALARAKGEIWVFNDDDRIPTPGFLEAHCARL